MQSLDPALKDKIVGEYGISTRTIERNFKDFKDGVSVLSELPKERSKTYPVKFPIVERQLVNWISKQRDEGKNNLLDNSPKE